MKYIAPVIALATVGLVAQSAQANKYDFKVYNNTGYTLERLYISESNSDIWGPDALGSGVLPSGYYDGVIFGNMSPNVCWYDFRAVFSNGVVLKDFRVNVCNRSGITYN